MKNAPNRRLLSRWSSIIARERVYEEPDGLEVEVDERIDVLTRRVYFEDVLLVTHHREHGKVYLTLTGLFALGFIVLVFFLASLGDVGVAVGIVFSFFGLPFLMAFLVRAIWGVDVVTVFGRRSKVALRFRIRKHRARELYGHICAAARSAQRKRAEEYAAAEEASGAAGFQPAEMPPLPPDESAG